MRQYLFAAAAAVAILASGSVLNRAEASPLGAGLSSAAGALSQVDQVRACWYEDGWNGPGWYQCGRWRSRGFGFFGFDGWGGRWHSGHGHGGRGHDRHRH